LPYPKLKGPITLVDALRREDATIDAIQALNIRHVKPIGYDKPKLTRTQ
jgi:hypothetical protein